MDSCNQPKESERTAEQWLRQIGAKNIQFLGDKREDGPPDYVIEYASEKIAVEVTLLHHNDGWGNRDEIAFGRKLHDFIAGVLEDENAPRWHVLQAEYDPREHKPPKTRKEHVWWKERLKTTLLSDVPPGTCLEVQLMRPEARQGRGISLGLIRAGNEGGPVLRRPGALDVTTDEGCWLGASLIERMTEAVRDKSRKVANARGRGSRAARYGRWWLVLDDEVMIAPNSILEADERRGVEETIRYVNRDGTWSKVVLVSRFQPAGDLCGAPDLETLQEQPKWYWPVWEAAEHPPLPPSP